MHSNTVAVRPNVAGISNADAVKLANHALVVYEKVSPDGQTLGDWVLDAFPELFLEHVMNGRDFYYAQRPSDAKYYLIGLLEDGIFDAKTLQEYLSTQLESTSA